MPTPTRVRRLALPPYGVSSTLPADSACQLQMTDAVELPFPSYAAVRLPDQLQFNPVGRISLRWPRNCARTGGLVIEGARVTESPGAAAAN